MLQLLRDMEHRLGRELGEIKETVRGTATTEDVHRIENRVDRLEQDVEALRGSDLGRRTVGDHKRHTWGVVAAAAGLVAALLTAVAGLIVAAH